MRNGEEIEITKHRRVIARLVPAKAQAPPKRPDFLARLRTIYGGKIL
ncbi:MAG: type II toxin-antitoxin system prevent-host-death family antitoxin, partial [Acidobacteria bacterium]